MLHGLRHENRRLSRFPELAYIGTLRMHEFAWIPTGHGLLLPRRLRDVIALNNIVSFFP
jgi:hypothetical protein